MEKIKTTSDLKSAIQQLEFEQSTRLILLKEELYVVCRRLKPINIIKDTLKEVYSDRDVETTVTDNLLGLTSGALARKIIFGKTNNPITRFAGALIERFVSKSVVKNANKIKTVAGDVLEKITNKYG
jgi:hypothetical protein